jgi:phosphoglycolate phosphatase
MRRSARRWWTFRRSTGTERRQDFRMSPRPTIAFDLDGTLVDTAPDLMAALNFVLGEAGLAAIEDAQMRNLVGGGARVMIERGLALHRVPAAAGDVDRMFQDFLRFYEKHIADYSKPFPGCAEMLDRLTAEGARLIVVTNKIERYSVQLLQTLGLADKFSVIAGPDTFGVRKPDPGHLLKAVERAGGDSARTVMIGDSITDVNTARAAKVPVVAVSFGYRSETIEELAADHVIDRLDELPALLGRIGFAAPR